MAQLVARLVRNEKVGGSNPPSSTTGRHPIRMSVFCMPGRFVAPLVFRAPRGALVGRAALCARGRRPARETSAPRASLGALSRSPARPRHRPRAPQPVPSGPSGAFHACGAGSLLIPQLWLLTSNFARNSSMTHSSIEFASLELQRFSGISKNDHDKLRAKFGWRRCRCRPRRRNHALNLPPALRPGRFVHCRPPDR